MALFLPMCLNYTPVANFMNHFWYKLHQYWHIALSFNLGSAAMVYKICQKEFYEIGTCGQFHKNIFSILYAATGACTIKLLRQ
jgi:hypothetical protein